MKVQVCAIVDGLCEFPQLIRKMATIHQVNIRRLDLNLLVVLDALLSEGSVTRAAGRVHLSQPAVSNALARLRIYFQDELFVRRGAKLEPTRKARALMQPIRDLLHQVDHVVLAHPVKFDPKRSVKTFRVAATDYVNFVLLPALLARLEIDAPSISIDVCELDRARPMDALLRDEIDLVLGSVSATNTYIHRADLFSDDYVCIARKGHPTIKKRLTLGQFVACSHVVIRQQNGGTGGILDEVLQQQGQHRLISISLPQFFAAPYIVMKTDALMTVTARIGLELEKAYPLRVLKHPVGLRPFTIAQLWHQRTHTDPTYQWFRKTIFDVARQMGKGFPIP